MSRLSHRDIIADEAEVERIFAMSKAEDKRRAIAEVVAEAIAEDRFTLTGVFMMGNPASSYVWELLDGIGLVPTAPDGWRPEMQRIPENLPPRLFASRLRHAEGLPHRHGTIAVPRTVVLPLFGTTKTIPSKEWDYHPDAVWVDDSWPERKARCLVFRDGIPLANKPRANQLADDRATAVVELRWLELHVTTSPVIGSGLKQLYEEIMTRPKVIELLNSGPSTPPPSVGVTTVAVRGKKAA